MKLTADEMMLKMGFPATETGPYVTELRVLVAKQVEQGMTNRSGGTWAEECYERDEAGFITGWKISHEERAKAFLAVEWELIHGHSFRQECLDPPIDWTYNTKTGRRGVRINWRDFLPWVGDRWRSFLMDVRCWRDRRAGRSNPYVSR